MPERLQSVYSSARENMQKAYDHLEKELMGIRAGKATPSMLDGVSVDYYGTKTPISQLANVSAPDARTLSIQPWDKAALPEIEKAIFASNMGLTPQNDGEVIRLNVPPLTTERRQQLAKQIKAEGEHAKVGIRNTRKSCNDEIKAFNKDGLSDDMSKDAEAEVQKITDNFGKKVDALVAAKEKEILTM